MRSSKLFAVDGKVVVITGACGGIGGALAEGFVAHGATVFAADISGKESVAPKGSIFCSVDVTAPDSVSDLAKFVSTEARRVDVLINTAAIIERGRAEALSLDEIERTLRVNFIGTLLCCREFGKSMMERRVGSIINFGSRAGIIGMPFSLAYNASKAGVILLTKTLAVEWGAYNIRINAIVPSLTRTALAGLDGSAARMDPRLETILGGRTPLGRVADPGDFVGAAIFLASSASEYVSGSAIVVDGGNLASGGIGTEIRDYELSKVLP